MGRRNWRCTDACRDEIRAFVETLPDGLRRLGEGEAMNAVVEHRLSCCGCHVSDFSRLRLKEKTARAGVCRGGPEFGHRCAGTKLGGQTGRVGEMRGCPDCRACYDLSLAKLLMNHVLMNTMVAAPWVGVWRLNQQTPIVMNLSKRLKDLLTAKETLVILMPMMR